MTPAGWIIMLLACGGYTALLLWCIHQVVVTPGAETRIHAQTDIDPRDPE